jgi:ribosomal protein L37AE/L43A
MATKRRAGKTYYDSLLAMKDERQVRKTCPYCGRVFHLFLVNDIWSPHLCVSCCMILDRAGVSPSLPGPSVPMASQSQESIG